MIELKDILINARQESHRMRHYYLGIEHLFIALLEIKGGLTSAILADDGISAEYVIDAIRRKAGKGSQHRLWAGIQDTPRAEVVMSIAQEIAQENQRNNITERDLLIAILDENDSLPIRVITAMGIDLAIFSEKARTRKIAEHVSQTFVMVEFAPNFGTEVSKDELFILRRMFHGYAKVRVETRLTGGYTTATLLVVTPIHVDNRQDAPVVVKIGETDAIQDEALRYERYVKNTLPPLTARLEDRPTAPETSDLAALKYTLLTDDNGEPTNLREVIRHWSGQKLGEWIQQNLYANFGTNWWTQNRPYRFEVWQEYDWTLPPVLTLDYVHMPNPPENAHYIKFPVKRARLNRLEYGETVVIDNFVVYKVDKENKSITLALGQNNNNRALQIEVRGIDFNEDTYYRGEIVERIVGRVWKTRIEQLNYFVRVLEPSFDVRDNSIRAGNHKLPNPLIHYSDLLNKTIMGTMSTIHGDLHIGNIMLGQNDNALLIDFAHARDGHTVFDWATLEISLISQLLSPYLSDRWQSVDELVPYLVGITNIQKMPTQNPDIADDLQAIRNVRFIVGECLHHGRQWMEYWVALAFVALRAVGWESMSVPQRRLMLYISALALSEIEHDDSGTGSGTQVPDKTVGVTENSSTDKRD
jgi:hypothetical protein